MSQIICATRGGEGSRAVQKAAIELAKETGQHLVFLYVIEADLLVALEEHMRSIVRGELFWLAKTMLRIAESRAKQAGVTPDLEIREGRLREEIGKIVLQTATSCLLMGAPRQASSNIFQHDEIEAFAQSIQEATGIAVHIIWSAVRAG
jgi:hypothetical protein